MPRTSRILAGEAVNFKLFEHWFYLIDIDFCALTHGLPEKTGNLLSCQSLSTDSQIVTGVRDQSVNQMG